MTEETKQDFRITEKTNPELHAKLKIIYESGGRHKRRFVDGPGGVTYKVLTPGDDVIIFMPQTGMDGKYNTRSTGGLVG